MPPRVLLIENRFPRFKPKDSPPDFLYSKGLIAWLLVSLLAIVILLTAQSALAGTWTPLVTPAPGSIGLMILLSDGTVMAKSSTGGGDSYGNTWYRLTPDSTGSYVNGTWSALSPMHDTRQYFASQVLTDGRVFVAGGEYGTGGAAAETYDPLANLWTEAPAAGHTFSDANSEILPDGRVLVALVEGSLRNTLIFDPVANTWTTGPTANGIHNESAWVKLPDDSTLFVDRLSTNSERYIPASNVWITDATVPVSLYSPAGDECGPGVLLPNGKVIMFGGTGHTAIYTPSGGTANGSWVAGPDIPNGLAMPDAPCVLLPNGKVLLAVCPVPVSGAVFQPPTTFYEYDYTTNSFASVPTPGGGTLNHASYYGTMLSLPDGTALYADFSPLVYSYQGGGTPVAAGKPTITSITQNNDGSYHLVGTQINGISEASEYGDDNQNATNYPIVRLTSGSSVYYARTYNWSRTSVATGSTPVTTEFTVPASVPSGSYAFSVVANGISSDPFTPPPPPMSVSPASGLTTSGFEAGPYNPASASYKVTNNGGTFVNWTAANTQSWVTLSSTSGTLAPGASVTVTVSVNSTANALSAGAYSDTVTFTNVTAGSISTRAVSLTVRHDSFTELFTSGVDTSNQSWLFTPNGMDNFYTVQRTASVASFPTTPTGGTTITLTDDSFKQVTPTGGAQVKLYGTSYSSFYIGSNGYITFNSGDITYQESLSAHFSQPRISPLFVDLNPAVAGTVSWRQLSDRVAVTWQSVPGAIHTQLNSFQVEMFFNGQIRITCLAIAVTHGLIGLSRGLGVPSDYASSDFDTYPTTPPSTNAALANLTLSAGAPTPGFAGGTMNYTASVSNATSTVTVTPTVADSTATVTVNGVPVASGSPSAAIALAVGNNNVTTVVTAQDRATTQVYTLTVTRRTPYQDWATGLGLSGTAMNPSGDFNSDGLANMLKWAFAIDTTAGVRGPLQISGGALLAHGVPVVLASPNGLGGTSYFALFGRRQDASTTGLSYAVQFSADLSRWTTSTATPSVVAQDSEIAAVTVPFPALMSGQAAAFFRVVVTAQ